MGDDATETFLYVALVALLVALVALVVILSMPSLVRRWRDYRHARVSRARRAAHTGINLFSGDSEPKAASDAAKRRPGRRGSSRKGVEKIDLFGGSKE